MTNSTIIVETKPTYAIITFNRPQALNALNSQMLGELNAALDTLESNPAIGAIVLTGNEKAFAAGADIKEMMNQSFSDVLRNNFITKDWERLTQCRAITIAAVSGFALGGGCEVAMMCDTIIAGDNAKFGQPEITLGITPGAGGTQRLTRAIGKAKAMEMCLTGRMIDAAEAERSGLVSRVVPAADLLKEANTLAEKIGGMPYAARSLVKTAINHAFESTLTSGVRFERQLFYSCFGTADQKEGMAAFSEKRKPVFKNQ